MSARRSRRARAWRPSLLALVAVSLVGASAAIAVAVSAGDSPTAHRANRGPAGRAEVTTTSLGTVTARRIDRRRGLIFEVDSSPDLGNSLSVRLTRDAPQSTRDAVMTNPLAATCDVPGEHVGEFAGFWDERFAQFGTALLTDDEVVVAKRATTCGLWIGEPGDTEDLALFGKQPFSRVRFR